MKASQSHFIIAFVWGLLIVNQKDKIFWRNIFFVYLYAGNWETFLGL